MLRLISGEAGARSLSNGPPGAICTNRNDSKLMTISSGIIPIKRLTKYIAGCSAILQHCLKPGKQSIETPVESSEMMQHCDSMPQVALALAQSRARSKPRIAHDPEEFPRAGVAVEACGHGVRGLGK